jgi:hypothetical protein
LLLTEPLLERDGKLQRATVTGRKRDANGNSVGNFNSNPLLNTRIYIAMFPDGHVAEYSVNVIADAIYQSTNSDGLDELLFEAIIGHESNENAFTSRIRDKNLPPKAGKYVQPGKMGQHLGIQ